MDQDLILQFFLFPFLGFQYWGVQYLFVPRFPGTGQPRSEHPQSGFPGVDNSGSDDPGLVHHVQAQVCFPLWLFPDSSCPADIPGYGIPCPWTCPPCSVFCSGWRNPLLPVPEWCGRWRQHPPCFAAPIPQSWNPNCPVGTAYRTWVPWLSGSS